MGLRKDAIEWGDETATPVRFSPARMLQQRLERHHAAHGRVLDCERPGFLDPGLSRDALRRMAMTAAAASAALWMTLITTTDLTTTLVA